MMLSGQVALVTGASRGIGRAIALELGSKGASVVGTATTENGTNQITEFLKAEGIVGEGVVLEVRDSSRVEEVVAQVTSSYGVPGILVNNAGITRDNLAMRMKDGEWADVIDTNLSAVFCLSKAVMKGMMKARYGRIINVTSVVGHSGNPGQANYCAAKAGVSGMTRALARELGSRNITVNCVAPGFIDTDMTKGLADSQRESLVSSIPLGRLGSPDDVAAAVGFLASKYAGYITGSTIHVNGGMHME